MDSIGKYLQEKRIAAGLSQGDVSDKLGYSTKQFVSNWERGVSLPPGKNFKLLCTLLKLNGTEIEKVSEKILKFALDKTKKRIKKEYGIK